MSKDEGKKKVREEEEWDGRMIDAYIDLGGEEITIGANTEQLIRMIDGAAECLQKRGLDTANLQTDISLVARQYLEQEAREKKARAEMKKTLAELEEMLGDLTKQALDIGRTFLKTEQERHG